MSDRIDWWFIHTSADVFAAWGQVIGALFTALAVIVALWVALTDRRRFDAERRDAAKQQARLLIIEPVVVSDRFAKIVLDNRSHEPLPSVWIPHLRATATEQDSVFANTAKEQWLQGYPGFLELDAQARWESDAISFAWQEKPDPKLADCTIHVGLNSWMRAGCCGAAGTEASQSA